MFRRDCSTHFFGRSAMPAAVSARDASIADMVPVQCRIEWSFAGTVDNFCLEGAQRRDHQSRHRLKAGGVTIAIPEGTPTPPNGVTEARAPAQGRLFAQARYEHGLPMEPIILSVITTGRPSHRETGTKTRLRYGGV